MAKIEKVVIGALAGIGVYAAGRAIAVSGRTRNLEPARANPRAITHGIRPIRSVAPGLSPARVRMMVVEWGMDPERFHGRALSWARVAAANAAIQKIEVEPSNAELVDGIAKTQLALPPADETPQNLFHRYLKDTATGGSFYAIRPGDTPETVARTVLSQLHDGALQKQSVLEYVWCFSAASYNRDRYGSRSTTKRFPEKWIVPGLGLGIRGAFMPGNADALDLMELGLDVPRTIDDDADSTVDDATSYGIIWLPPVCPKALAKDGSVTCYPFPWSDGSTSLEPPPEWIAHTKDQS